MQVFNAEAFGKLICFKQWGGAFPDGDNVVVIDFRADPFFLSPYAAAVRADCVSPSLFKKILPFLGGFLFQGFYIVLYFQEAIAFFASVYNVIEGILFIASGETFEFCVVVWHFSLLFYFTVT
jgi:hypothetical protein